MFRVAVAAAATLLATAVTAPSATAEPQQRQFEWWFGKWQIEKIWEESTTGEGVTVAVLDSGVNASLPDLAGVVLPGGDVLGQGTGGHTDIAPDNGHGTSMAALIAGQGNSQIYGVAPGARILPVLVDTTDDEAAAAQSEGIRFAVDNGADVINISIGVEAGTIPNNCPTEVQDAIRHAVEQDVIVVAAAGNEGDSTNFRLYPAACKGVVAVGAIGPDRLPWESTQQREYVDVAAPGVDIVSVSKTGEATLGHGTSPAAALTSGALALVRAAHPDLSARQIVARMLATASDVGAPGEDDRTGIGVVLPFQAINENVPPDAPNPIFDELESTTEEPPATGGTPGQPGQNDPPPGDDQNTAVGDDSEDGGFPIGLALGGVAAAVVVAFVVFLLVRRGRSGGGPGGGGPGGPPPYPAYPDPNIGRIPPQTGGGFGGGA